MQTTAPSDHGRHQGNGRPKQKAKATALARDIFAAMGKLHSKNARQNAYKKTPHFACGRQARAGPTDKASSQSHEKQRNHGIQATPKSITKNPKEEQNKNKTHVQKQFFYVSDPLELPTGNPPCAESWLRQPALFQAKEETQHPKTLQLLKKKQKEEQGHWRGTRILPMHWPDSLKKNPAQENKLQTDSAPPPKTKNKHTTKVIYKCDNPNKTNKSWTANQISIVITIVGA